MSNRRVASPGETDSRLTLLAHLHMQRDFRAERIEYREPMADVPGRQVDIPKLKRGGVDCIWLSEGSAGGVHGESDACSACHRASEHGDVPADVFRGGSPGVQRLLRGFDAVRRLCAASEDLDFVTSTPEIRAAAAAGKIAVLIHTENLLMAEDLSMLRAYHELGLRVTGLVHGAPQTWIDCDCEQGVPERTDRLWPRGGSGVEPAGDPDGRVACFDDRHRSGAGGEPGSDRGFPLQSEGDQPDSAQLDG